MNRAQLIGSLDSRKHSSVCEILRLKRANVAHKDSALFVSAVQTPILRVFVKPLFLDSLIRNKGTFWNEFPHLPGNGSMAFRARFEPLYEFVDVDQGEGLPFP